MFDLLREFFLSAAILGGAAVQPAHPPDATPRIENRRVMQKSRARSTIEFSFRGDVVPLPATRPKIANLQPAVLPAAPAAEVLPRILFRVDPDPDVPSQTWDIKFGQLPPAWFQIFGFVG